jgi:hypothetical protein
MAVEQRQEARGQVRGGEMRRNEIEMRRDEEGRTDDRPHTTHNPNPMKANTTPKKNIHHP